MTRITGRELAKQHGLRLAQALYRATGDWYHVPGKFPSALMDREGYIIFETESNFRSFLAEGSLQGISFSDEKNWLRVSDGISGHPAYIRYDHLCSAEEMPEGGSYLEGSVQRAIVNIYERDPSARNECLRHWGFTCCVCGFNFLERYGEIGRGFIHVHHLVPIASNGSTYQIDPINDLRPVCPNCHAMIHRRNEPFSIEEVRSKVRPSRT